MKEEGMKVGVPLVAALCLMALSVLSAGTMTAKVVEVNKGFCASGPDTFCVFEYELSMEFKGETGSFGYLDNKLKIKPPLHDEVMKASSGNLPKIFCMLLPQEASMKVIRWENNDPENNNPPEPRFPKGPGGIGIPENAAVGWIVGEKVYLTYGFVGAGIYGFFATWDCDEEISENQPQPGGCTPWYGGDEGYYIVPLSQMKSGETFTINREFDSTDGDMWHSHSVYKITFNP
jgi:hypothetical protein